MPDDQKTAVNTASPPPKKPPVVDAEVFTPKPPPDPSHIPSFQELKKKGPPSDQHLLNLFKADPVNFIRELNLPKNNAERVRLKRLIDRYAPKDQQLYQAWEATKAQIPNLREKSLTLSRKTQTQPAPAQEIPTVTTEELTQQEPAIAPKEKKLEDLTPPERQKLEAWMNGLKSHVFNSFARSANRDVGTIQLFTRTLLGSLAMYRGGLADFYLSEGTKELLFSALGPIGDAFRSLDEKDMQRKMAWMKNPLNPNAINYYLTSLPNQLAFKILYLPAQAAFGILARGGAPLISKVHYQRYGQNKQSYVFTPLLKATQFTNKLADGIDKLSGVVTDETSNNWGEKSPFDRYLENKNSAFSTALKELKSAKLSKNKDIINKAQHNLRLLLNEHDGFYRYYQDKKGHPQEISQLPFRRRAVYDAAGFSRAIFKNGLKNFSRRLRHTSRDPFIGIFSLIAGTLADIVIGLGFNALRVIGTRAVDLISSKIPGLNTLRANLTEFFTSNRYLTTARIGGATGRAFMQGTFSMTTASSIYGGASIGGWIANSFGLPTYPFQVIGGGVGATFGSVYTTALKMAHTGIPNWVQSYQTSKLMADSNTLLRSLGERELTKGFINRGGRLFGPGPLSRFANWLSQHPFARLPINGFVWRNILQNILPPEFLATKFLGIPVGFVVNWLPAIDYFWQIKGGLAKLLTQPSWNIFGKTYPSFHYRLFNLSNPNSFFSNIAQKIHFQWLKIAYEPAGLLYIEKPWLEIVNKYIVNPLGKAFNFAQPFFKNFFNPGLLMGFNLIPVLTPALGGWAYLAGPALGSASWLVASRISAAILGKSFMAPAAFMAKFNALGWTGFLIGQLTGWLLFGWNIPLWYTAVWSVGFPTLVMGLNLSFTMLASALGTSVTGLISAITGLSVSTIATSLAIWSTVMAVSSIALMTVFFAYTIYSGFWVPLLEESTAGPQSSNFTIDTNVTKIAPNKFEICSPFSVTEAIFNSRNNLIHKFDFQTSYLTVNLTEPEKTTHAFRDQQQLDYIINLANISPDYYSLTLPDLNPPDPPIVGFAQILSFLESFLSTPSNLQQNLKALMSQDQSVVFSLKPFFDILTGLAQEFDQPHHLVAEYEAQLALIKQQKNLVRDLIDPVKKGNLDKASQIAETYLTNNPLPNYCPDTNLCPEEKQGLKQLYDSWTTIVTRYQNTIAGYFSQTNPKLAGFLALLEQELEDLDQQIDFMDGPDGLIQKIKSAQAKILTQRDADALTQTNFLSFSTFTPDQQDAAWNLLAKYFPDVFTNNLFYYIPKNTNYRVCVEADYCYAVDPSIAIPDCPTGEPVTVCSSISYTPSAWGPNAAFAKACATFIP